MKIRQFVETVADVKPTAELIGQFVIDYHTIGWTEFYKKYPDFTANADVAKQFITWLDNYSWAAYNALR